jgi:hypothetical protein
MAAAPEGAPAERRLDLASASAGLQARLLQKRYLPTALIGEMLPAGSMEVSHEVPRMAADERPEAERLHEFVVAIRSTMRVFGRFHHTTNTLGCNDRYMVWLDSWGKLSGFGSHIVVDATVRCVAMCLQWRESRASEHVAKSVCVVCAQLEPGRIGFITPAKRDGEVRVMLPEMLVGCVLEMVTGSELTPKGGLERLVSAFEAKLERPKSSGAFGEGAYKDEPWALVSIRARVTAARVFYDVHLGTKDGSVNPGYSEILTGTMASIALLIGEHAEHVSWPLAHCE